MRGSRLVLAALAVALLPACKKSSTPPAAPVVTGYRVGGTVAGLTGTGLVLQNNGGDDLGVGTSGSFAFPTRVAAGGSYAVTVRTQPSGQACVVAAGAGTVGSADVTSVVVTCTAVAPVTYTVGGTVSGLTGSGLVLQNNGGDDLAVAADGPFTFATRGAAGSAYLVTIRQQPTSQICAVASGAGALAANVTSVAVTCQGPSPRYAFAVDGADGTLLSYAVDARTGQLRAHALALTGVGPSSVAADPTGAFAFVANRTAGTVMAFAVGANGRLSLVRVAVAVGPSPRSIAADPTGRFVYVAS